MPDNAGSLPRQFGSVVRKIVKLALPPLPGRGGSGQHGGNTVAEASPEELVAAA
jgi:hypothetical protein